MNKKTRTLLVLVLIVALAVTLTLVFRANKNNKPSEISIDQKIENKVNIDEMDVSYIDSLKEHFIRQMYKGEKGLEDSDIIESKYEKWKEDNKELLEEIKVEVIDDDE
jgi:uncharacterized ion transporter superfamily protein YfcC